MKRLRFGDAGRERPGLQLADGRWVDASACAREYDEAFFASGGLTLLRDWMNREGDQAPTVQPHVRLGPPVARPSKIVCIGLNSRDHAAESGMDLPAEPVLFFKATTSLVGPNDDLVMPKGATKVDWEVELALGDKCADGVCRSRRGSFSNCRVCVARRLLRTCVSVGARRAMGQGKKR